MKKNYAKEIIIMMLLFIIIMLIMAVALYDFVPSSISIPELVEYTADSSTVSVKQEIEYTNGGDIVSESEDGEEVSALRSYSIEAGDLVMYSQKNLYNSGNSNPFDYAEETVTETNAEGTPPATSSNQEQASQEQASNGQASNGQVQGGQTQNGGSSQGTFFEKKNEK